MTDEERSFVNLDASLPTQEPEESNVYVLELKKVFDSCQVEPTGQLDLAGLSLLCAQLNLSEHTPYIAGQLLPLPGSKINFSEFKRPTESPSKKKSKKGKGGVASQKGRSLGPSPLVDVENSIDNLPTPVDSPAEGKNPRSDNDTSRDILSDFSDDGLLAKNRGNFGQSGITVEKLQRKLRELGLSDNGYLGRYELRLLCQHVDELKHLRAEISENEIFDLTDTNNDGRISLQEFCDAYNKAYGSRHENPPEESCSSNSDSSASPEPQRGNTTYTKLQTPALNPPDLLLSPSQKKRKNIAGGGRHKSFLGKSRSEDVGEGKIPGFLPETGFSRKNTGSGRALRDFRSAFLYKSDTGQSLRRKGGSRWSPRGPNLHNTTSAEISGKNQSSNANILSSLDTSNTGFTSFRSIIDYWESMGMERSREILESIGYSDRNRSINLIELSEALQTHLSHASLSPEAAVAVLCFRAELEYLRISLSDVRGRSDHYKNELAELQMRQNMLIEELDQSQASMEIANRQKVSEIEEKYQIELRGVEDRQKAEKQDLISHLTEVEDLLHQKRQSESTLKNRVGALERESGRLKRDNQDLTQTISELEALNEDLRKELQTQTALMSRKISRVESAEKKVADFGNSDNNKSQDFLWRHKAELAIAENKRLKDQIDELLEGGAPARKSSSLLGRYSPRGGGRKPIRRQHRRGSNMGNYLSNAGGSQGSSTALNLGTGGLITSTDAVEKFRRAVHKHRRRKTKGPEEESSEFESDPDPVGSRPKYKRTLKRKERSGDLEKREQRQKLHAAKVGAKLDRDSTDSDKTGGSVTPVLGRSLSGVQIRHLQRQFSDERKQIEHQLKVEMAGSEDKWTAERKQIYAQFEREKARIRNQSEQELQMIMDSRRKETQEALRSQELELEAKFDGIKREMQVRWTSERNAMERAFAEEKMVMITQLQEDFDMELRKVKQGKGQEVREYVSPAGEHKRLEELKKEKQILEDSIDGQRHGFEAKMASIQKKHDERVQELESRLKNLEEWVTPEDLPDNLKRTFYKLEDEWREGQRDKIKQERDDMMQGVKQEREQLVATLEVEKDTMMKQHSAQLADLDAKHQRGLEEAQRSLEEARKRPITDTIEVQTEENLPGELESKRRRVEQLESHVTALETGFAAKETDYRNQLNDAQAAVASRPQPADCADKMTQSESETGGRDPDSLIGNLRMDLDLEKEKCQDLEDEMKELRERLGVVQRDSKKRLKDAQERVEEAVRKTAEETQRKVGVETEAQTDEDLGAMLETAMDGARQSQEELIRLKEELNESKQSVEEKREQMDKLQERLTAVQVEYSNKLNDAHVKLEEVSVELKERVKETVTSDCQTEKSLADLEKEDHTLATCQVELSIATNRIAELEQMSKLQTDEIQKNSSQLKNKELEAAEKLEEAKEEIEDLKKEIEKTREEKAQLNDAQAAAALKERDRLQKELMEAQQREVIYCSQIEDAQITLDNMSEDLKKAKGTESAEVQLMDTQIALKAVSEELQRKTAEFNAQEIEAQVRLRESQKECELVVEEVERLKQKEAELEKNLESANEELKRKEDELVVLRLQGQEMSGKEEAIKQLTNAQEEIRGLKAREQELGKSAEDAKNQLKNARNEAEEMRSFSDDQKEQLRGILEEKSHTESDLWEKIGVLNAEKTELEIRLKNLEGEQVVKKEEQQTLMAERQSTLERHQSEKESLAEEVERINDEMEEARKVIEQGKDEVLLLRKSEASLKEELEQKKKHEDALKSSVENAKALERNLIRDVEKLGTDISQLKNEKDQLTEKLKAVQQSENDMRLQCEALRRAEAEQKATLEKLAASEAGLLLELDVMKKIENEQRARLDAFQEASTSEEGMKKDLEMLRASEVEKTAELHKLKAAEVDYKKLLNDAQNSLVKAADDIISMTNKEERLRQKLRDTEDELRQAEEERVEMEEELSRAAIETSDEVKEVMESTRKELEKSQELEEFYRNQAAEAKSELEHALLANRRELTDAETQSGGELQHEERKLHDLESSTTQKCGKCHLLEGRIAELEHTINLTSESGIEDAGSSPDYYKEDPVYLKQENDKLKSRLHAAQEKMLELRTCLVLAGSQQIREECATRHFAPVDALQRMRQPILFDLDEESGFHRDELREIEKTLAGEVEKFREENFLLQARLDAKESLLQDTVEKYRSQLKETASLGRLVQELYKENGSLVGRLGASLKGPGREAVIGQAPGTPGADWSEAKEALQDLYVELGRRAK